MQLIVLGMHRSGTSMAARLLNMMGAYFAPEGQSLGFNADNPKGYWERRDVLRFNQQLMQLRGCSWFDLRGWDWQTPFEAPPPIRRQMRGLVLEMDAHRPWLLKDPRLCLTLPAWRPLLEVPVAVLISRDPLEVALSLNQRNQYPLAFGLALWESHIASALNAARSLPLVHVAHEALLADPVQAVQQLHADLLAHEVQGLRLPSLREILAFVEPKLYRARQSSLPPDQTLSAYQQALYRMLRGEEMIAANLTVSDSSLMEMQRFLNEQPRPNLSPAGAL